MSSDLGRMLDGIRARMREQGVEWSDAEFADLADALSHPDALKTIREGFEKETQSVQKGQEAPDFALKFLLDPTEPPLRLSSHFGSRPVALVFGSYT